MSKTSLPKDRKSVNKRLKLFWDILCQTQDPVKAYNGAGYKSKNADHARQNACRLVRQLDKQLDFKRIMDSTGLTDRHISGRLRKIVDNPDDTIAIKGLNLATRCKGHQQPQVNVGVGVQIVIGSQRKDDIVDVEAETIEPIKDKPIQITD